MIPTTMFPLLLVAASAAASFTTTYPTMTSTSTSTSTAFVPSQPRWHRRASGCPTKTTTTVAPRMQMVPDSDQQTKPSSATALSSIDTSPAATSPTATATPLLWMPAMTNMTESETDESSPQQQHEENNLNQAAFVAPATAARPRSSSLRAKLGLPDDHDDDGTTAAAACRHTHVKVVGHRGALYECLENTRDSFIRCAQLGGHAVEMDVFVLPRDGSVVVFHGSDTDPKRPGLLHSYFVGYHQHNIDNNNHIDNNATQTQQQQQQKHSILDLTYEESQLLRFNPDHAEFGCDREIVQRGRIPLLQDVLMDLQAFPDLEIKIELKGIGRSVGIVQPVLDIVERLQMQRQCSYSSFHLSHLRELRRLRPDTTRYRTGALFTVPPSNVVDLARDCGATEIHLQYDECTVERITAIHHAGMASMAWCRGPVGMRSDAQHKYAHDLDDDGDDERCYRTVLETGVQQLCCNRPDVALRLLLATTTSSKQQQQQDESQQVWSVG